MSNEYNQGKGVGSTKFTTEAYLLSIRMLADNWKPTAIVAEIQKRFPQHRVGGEAEITRDNVKGLQRHRAQEIAELRSELQKQVDDIWIANKRTRLEALASMFGDANRWNPKKTLELPLTNDQRQRLANDEELTQEEDRLRTVVVYEKDFGALLGILKQAQQETGGDASSRQATSLEQLVELAEKDRGLDATIEVEPGTPVDGAVPMIHEAALVDTPTRYDTAGPDPSRSLLDGAAGLDEEDL